MTCGDHVDLTHAHMPPYGQGANLPEARRLFDARAAAAVASAVALGGLGENGPPRIWPPVQWRSVPLYGDGTVTYTNEPTGQAYFPGDLLELKSYFLLAPTIFIPTATASNKSEPVRRNLRLFARWPCAAPPMYALIAVLATSSPGK